MPRIEPASLTPTCTLRKYAAPSAGERAPTIQHWHSTAVPWVCLATRRWSTKAPPLAQPGTFRAHLAHRGLLFGLREGGREDDAAGVAGSVEPVRGASHYRAGWVERRSWAGLGRGAC